MTWDPNPWAVENSQSSADLGRIVANQAVSGHTGILNPTALRVLALDSPGTQVRIMPGIASIPCNATGKLGQAYIGINPTTDYLSIPGQGSSGSRTDLIVARVENPISGEPWYTPDDPLVGPYIFTRRIPNVDPNTTTVTQVDPASSAITLARITVPANTTTITAGMITDLRKRATLAAQVAENKIVTDNFYHGGQNDQLLPTNNIFKFWPATADSVIKIPEWAISMDIQAQVHAEQQINVTGQPGHVWGEARINVGAGTGTGLLYTVGTEFDQDFPLSHDNKPNLSPTSIHMPVIGKVAIPSNMRGTTQHFRFEARMYSDTNTKGRITARNGGHSILLVNFKSGVVY